MSIYQKYLFHFIICPVVMALDITQYSRLCDILGRTTTCFLFIDLVI